jgi:hypothetical protein
LSLNDRNLFIPRKTKQIIRTLLRETPSFIAVRS